MSRQSTGKRDVQGRCKPTCTQQKAARKPKICGWRMMGMLMFWAIAYAPRKMDAGDESETGTRSVSFHAARSSEHKARWAAMGGIKLTGCPNYPIHMGRRGQRRRWRSKEGGQTRRGAGKGGGGNGELDVSPLSFPPFQRPSPCEHSHEPWRKSDDVLSSVVDPYLWDDLHAPEHGPLRGPKVSGRRSARELTLTTSTLAAWLD